MVAGESVDTGLPRHHVVHLPFEGSRQLRTEVEQVVLVDVDTIARGEPCLAVEERTVDIAVVHGQRREVDGTRELLVEPLHLVVHTETDTDVQGREEVGVGLQVVSLETARELRVGQHLQRVVPLVGSLQSHLAGIAEEVLVRLEAVHGVGARGLEAQLHLEFVLPLPLRLVVVVSLEGETAHSRVVRLTALVPVAADVVLHELQVAVALVGPELRLRHLHLHRVGLRLSGHRLSLLHHLHRLHDGLLNDVVAQ